LYLQGFSLLRRRAVPPTQTPQVGDARPPPPLRDATQQNKNQPPHNHNNKQPGSMLVLAA
jgi:hypothetical protein